MVDDNKVGRLTMNNKELQELLKQYPDDIKITLETSWDWYDITKVFLHAPGNSEPEIMIVAEEDDD